MKQENQVQADGVAAVPVVMEVAQLVPAAVVEDSDDDSDMQKSYKRKRSISDSGDDTQDDEPELEAIILSSAAAVSATDKVDPKEKLGAKRQKKSPIKGQNNFLAQGFGGMSPSQILRVKGFGIKL